MMLDRVKAIKGLTCCINDDNTVPRCEECPYREVEGTCTNLYKLHGDALELLKAKEPHVIRRQAEERED